MTTQTPLEAAVQRYFVLGTDNCAMTTLRVLGEHFDVPIPPAVLDAAQCMPGAGGNGGLCGLVAGALMFVGLWGGQHGHPRAALGPVTQTLNTAITQRFGSTLCRDLRREAGCGTLAVELLAHITPVLERAFAVISTPLS